MQYNNEALFKEQKNESGRRERQLPLRFLITLRVVIRFENVYLELLVFKNPSALNGLFSIDTSSESNH